MVNMPHASNPGVKKKRRQAGLRAARGITLFLEADRSVSGMELCMSPIRPVTSCCSSRTRQPGMSATGVAAPAAGAPVRLLAMSGRKNAST